MAFQNLVETYSVGFGSGSSFSGSVFLGGNGLIGVGNPGTWTAAPLTFQTTLGTVAPDAGGTWCAIVPAGAGSEYAISAGTMVIGTAVYLLPPADLPSLLWVRLVSGNSAGGTAQGAARSLTLITRPF